MTPRIARLAALGSAVTAMVLALTGSAAAQDEGEPRPSDSRQEDEALPAKPDLPPPSARWNVAVTGLGMTAGFYGGALVASLGWRTGAWAPKLRIPIVGPWLAMPDFKCGTTHHYACGVPLVAVRGILAGLDSVGQVGGLAVALESLFLPVRRSDHAGHLEPPHAWVRPVPFIVGRDTIGLGVVGEL